MKLSSCSYVCVALGVVGACATEIEDVPATEEAHVVGKFDHKRRVYLERTPDTNGLVPTLTNASGGLCDQETSDFDEYLEASRAQSRALDVRDFELMAETYERLSGEAGSALDLLELVDGSDVEIVKWHTPLKDYTGVEFRSDGVINAVIYETQTGVAAVQLRHGRLKCMDPQGLLGERCGTAIDGAATIREAEGRARSRQTFTMNTVRQLAGQDQNNPQKDSLQNLFRDSADNDVEYWSWTDRSGQAYEGVFSWPDQTPVARIYKAGTLVLAAELTDSQLTCL